MLNRQEHHNLLLSALLCCWIVVSIVTASQQLQIMDRGPRIETLEMQIQEQIIDRMRTRAGAAKSWQRIFEMNPEIKSPEGFLDSIRNPVTEAAK